MLVDQLGANYAQPDFNLIRIINLVDGDDVSGGLTSPSTVIPKAGMSVMMLARLINFDDANYKLTIQQKQNGAWANKPDVPPIDTIAADGVIRRVFTVNQFTEIRVVITENGGGTPVGNMYVDLFI